MYEESKKPFSEEIFLNPGKEYRGAPFWSWNGDVQDAVLDRQMEAMKAMGLGGYHIHSRIGLETEYLGEEFLNRVRHCVEYGKKHEMLTWLYDEDKWPSGVGGGRVTIDRRLASRYLLLSPKLYPDGFLNRKLVSTSRLSKNGEVCLICRYAVKLEQGRLVSYHRLAEGETAETVWYAYLLVTERLSWFNKEAYVDTLNPEAIERFIAVTHERYKQACGEEFGKAIPAIFTDEPSFHMQEELPSGAAQQDIGLAYTDRMEQYFTGYYGYSLLERIPELVWEKADGTLSQVRYHYHDCVARMFAEAYAKTLGDWCEKNNLLLTGHLLFEDKLESQSRVVGEVMQGLRYFGLPGIDMLADRHEYTTAKEAQSVARQYGRPGVTCELYGVTNWDFDFRGHKHQGDWLAALGVTNRVHHLVWMTMKGESKRDYPSPLDEHTTWYTKYPLIEDYFARINTVLTRGKASCRIGMLHPVESYWVLMGPTKETKKQRDRLEAQFQDTTEWLLFHQLDFDYISEALLPECHRPSQDRKLHVGEMAYEAVLVPGMITMRRTTLQALQDFANCGGTVIFAGTVPTYLDGLPSDEVQEFAKSAVRIGYERDALLDALEPYRDVQIETPGGEPAQRLIYQLREDGPEKWLFIAQGKHDDRLETTHWVSQTGREDFLVTIRGMYTPVLYDANTGEHRTLPVTREAGRTTVLLSFYAQDSYLLRLVPAAEEICQRLSPSQERKADIETYLPGRVDYRLAEPNVLLLDRAEFSLDGGDWQGPEEILRLDAAVRRQCGYPMRNAASPQPWLEPVKPEEHTLQLRCRISSEVSVPEVEAAFELKKGMKLFLDGENILWESQEPAFYVDSAIRRVKLGTLSAGEHELQLELPFGPGTDPEAGYLLGNFGVKLLGEEACLIQAPDRLYFGDLAAQGLPFYGGTVHYCCEIRTDGRDVELEVPEYFGALVEVTLDGETKPLYAEPYRVRFAGVTAGVHTLTVTLYGSRINTFGQVHNAGRKERYWGNKTWRTYGKNWSYVYQLRKTGVTLPPILRLLTPEENL